MPISLANLYCTAADVNDYLSSVGVQLRLDDYSQGTSQQVTINSAASAGATSIVVTALTQPLPNGCVLDFDGAGLDAIVQVVLTGAAPAGSTSLSCLALSGALPVGAFAFDNGVNVSTNARVLKARQYATSRIKMYCCSRYDDSELVQSWSVNRWATILAGRWLAQRRGQVNPKSVDEDFKEAMQEMKAVQHGQLQIEDINARTSSWPAYSNVSIDLTYDHHKVRVEQSMSEPTVTQYAQWTDWWDAQSFQP